MVPLKGSAPALFSTFASVFQVSCVFLIHRTLVCFLCAFSFFFSFFAFWPVTQAPRKAEPTAHTPRTAVCKDTLSTATLCFSLSFSKSCRKHPPLMAKAPH